MLAVKEFEDDKFIVMGTRLGIVKKTALSAFSNPRAGGIIAVGVEAGDSVIAAQVTDGSGEVFIAHPVRHGDPLSGNGRAPDGPRRVRGSRDLVAR